jgi:hypothetical protein
MVSKSSKQRFNYDLYFKPCIRQFLVSLHPRVGGYVMLPMIIAGVVLCALGFFGLYVGVRIARVLREQFDELLPQRMIDYSGFVAVDPVQD